MRKCWQAHATADASIRSRKYPHSQISAGTITNKLRHKQIQLIKGIGNKIFCAACAFNAQAAQKILLAVSGAIAEIAESRPMVKKMGMLQKERWGKLFLPVPLGKKSFPQRLFATHHFLNLLTLHWEVKK